jgi:hypothetical protein
MTANQILKIKPINLSVQFQHGCYGGNKQAEGLRVLVVGAGPIGLRYEGSCDRKLYC